MTGCSSGAEKTSPASVTAPSTVQVGVAAAPSGVSISPAGVTTNISVPAYSTEEQYFQACHAAKTWMVGHPGDRHTQVERYLAAVQTPGAVGAGTWNTAWAALPLARQAGVIVAAKAAANDECG
ncbi:lipoprotein LpqV [Mycobacterium sp.]|uniref:lipoprotein LpqV n=1 Tax=Mycobacterium sp. TaxID=1785 RepID=UPI003BB1BBE3